MKRTLLIASLLLVAAVSSLFAADNTINVSGSSVVTIPADKASIVFGVVTESAVAADAVAENSTKSNTLIEAIFAAGIAKKDIQTARYSIDPVVEYPKNGAPKTVAYRVTNRVVVETKDLKKLGALIDAATKAGANDIDSINFTAEDSTAARNEALVNAIKQAREKAELIAQTLGVKLGKVSYVSESYSGPTQRNNFVGAKGLMMMDAAVPETSILSGDIDISVNVNINFEIAYR